MARLYIQGMEITFKGMIFDDVDGEKYQKIKRSSHF